MIADLHAHFPMHVEMGGSGATLDQMLRLRGRSPGDFARSLALRLASRALSDRSWWSGERVNVPLMRKGGVGLAFSVLYSAFEEMDVSKPYGAPPDSSYFDRLLEQLERVDAEAARWEDPMVRVARDRDSLDRAVGDGALTLVHCVEGGFHLGDEPEEIDRNVSELARRGVAYVTLAHLFWRQVATNANAIPFLSAGTYRWLFPQPREAGLTERGRAAVRAMARERVMVDLSHMRADAIEETLTCWTSWIRRCQRSPRTAATGSAASGTCSTSAPSSGSPPATGWWD